MTNKTASTITFKHPYSLEKARWIREKFVMEKDAKKRTDFLMELSESFGTKGAEVLNYIANDYRVFVRDDQLWPDFEDDSWNTCVWSCGRAYGKTFCGVPAAIEFAIQYPGTHMGLLAPSFAMARGNMVLGASGIIKLSPPGFKPTFNKSEGSLKWPNGSTAQIFSSENGDRVRGQNLGFILADEFAFFKFSGDDKDLWKMSKLALRAGKSPKSIITTSPKPINELKELHKQSKKKGSKVIFKTGTTFDNYTLPQSYIDEVKLDEGTSLYNQEILGMILDENPNAIFDLANIKRVNLDDQGMDPDEYDKRYKKLLDSMNEIVVSVDPHVSEEVDSDLTGITVLGRKGSKGYIFEDFSKRGKLKTIYEDIVKYYYKYNADCIVAEVNQGGDLIQSMIHNVDEMVPVEKVFASKGKKSRAEPIGLLYERGQIYHVGVHRELESEMCEYNPTVSKKSPDRMDSMVWGLTKLFPNKSVGMFSNGSVTESFDLRTNKTKQSNLYHEEMEILSGKKDPVFSMGDDRPSLGTGDFDVFGL